MVHKLVSFRMQREEKCNLVLIYYSNTHYIPFTTIEIILSFKNRKGGAVVKSDK